MIMQLSKIQTSELPPNRLYYLLAASTALQSM